MARQIFLALGVKVSPVLRSLPLLYFLRRTKLLQISQWKRLVRITSLLPSGSVTTWWRRVAFTPVFVLHRVQNSFFILSNIRFQNDTLLDAGSVIPDLIRDRHDRLKLSAFNDYFAAYSAR